MAELSRRNIDLLTHFAEANPPAVDILVDLVLSHRPKLAERASWVLEKRSERNPGQLNISLPRLIDNLKHIPSSSTRGCYNYTLRGFSLTDSENPNRTTRRVEKQ